MPFSDWLSALTQATPRELNPRLQALKAKIRNDPYYRFRSLEEVQLAIALGIQIDANRSTVDDWLRLPGLSIHQARTLVELSQAGVPFYCIEDLAAALGMSLQWLEPLRPILRFCYYDPEGVDGVQRLNPNTASAEQLAALPGVDPYLARTIVQKRQLEGKYRNLVDLQRRLFLPPAVTAQLMHYLQF